MNDFKVGEYCMCYYLINPGHSNHIDLYWCRIIKFDEDGEHVTCQLYHGDELNVKNVKGTFRDVLVADLKKP